MRNATKAVIPAAGLGTRFLPATKAIPKEMLPIVDVPTLQLNVEEAVAAGLSQIVLVNGRGKGTIEDHFDIAFELERTLQDRGKSAEYEAVHAVSMMCRLTSVRQKRPLGLGHAVLCARGPVADDEFFAVILGDDLMRCEVPAIEQLKVVGEREGKGVIALMEVPDDQTHRYGIVAGQWEGEVFRIEELVEKPAQGQAPSNLAIMGRYFLPGSIFDHLARTGRGHGGEIQLTDALQSLCAEEGMLGIVVKGERFDAGDKLGYLHANLAYALEREELREGVLAMMRELLEREGS
ncbi:MAG: UTP--glucose-1-phosphate uridylyltransferase [Deltaproteobacteria bacterium]|nr:UTP--glucose-1-phosphate uridylyltransferase [Deltaproteobacteria bacterium]